MYIFLVDKSLENVRSIVVVQYKFKTDLTIGITVELPYFPKNVYRELRFHIPFFFFSNTNYSTRNGLQKC